MSRITDVGKKERKDEHTGINFDSSQKSLSVNVLGLAYKDQTLVTRIVMIADSCYNRDGVLGVPFLRGFNPELEKSDSLTAKWQAEDHFHQAK